MEKNLLANLADNQAFDAALAKGKATDKLVAGFLASILFEPSKTARDAAIAALENALVSLFVRSIQPAALTIGARNAARVLSKLKGPRLLPAPPLPPGSLPVLLPSGLPDFPVFDPASGEPMPLDLNNPALRQLVLIDANLRAADRALIIQHLVNDAANTLGNRLAAFWLTPGLSINQKLQQLRQLHFQHVAARAKYDQQVKGFDDGTITTRPRKPKLNFLDKLAEDVKDDFRVQARRAGADAEVAKFTKAGYEVLAWVAVNASQACPDCRLRQSVKGDAAFWDKWGRPGDGRTICGQNCYCLLVPAETITDNPGLKNGLNQPKKGVLTSLAEAAALNAAR